MLRLQRGDVAKDALEILSSIDVYQIPARPPPPGVISNFVDPESEGTVCRVIIYLTWLLMILFLLLRIYARSRITKSVGADDFLSLAAAAVVTTQSFITLFLLDNPLGPLPWNVRRMSLTPRVMELLLVLTSTYPVASIFLKSSLLVFYLRIFRPKRVPRITIWISLGIITIFYLVLAVYSPTTCHPWSTSLTTSGQLVGSGLLPMSDITRIVEEGRPDALQEIINIISQALAGEVNSINCGIAQLCVSVVGGIFSAVTDIYLLLLPTWLVIGLRLPIKRKIGICGIFLIGVLACVCSIIGVYFRILSPSIQDYTRLTAVTLSLAVVEINVGIICSCMPVLPVVYKHIKGSTIWVSLSNLIPTIWGHNTELNPQGSREPSSAQILQNNRVKIPAATLTGLRSFIWKSCRTRPGLVAELSIDTGISSVNDEYHTHIKGVDARRMYTAKDMTISSDKRISDESTG
ncbi:hypothetical protein F5Y04DRAFT_210805 [Hypomontagnella monticulosa]|nr:hypothetical protein F5Y04DRAFT_210805 [Hypomontagnella monticulosa]